jgi:hypothetical protein
MKKEKKDIPRGVSIVKHTAVACHWVMETYRASLFIGLKFRRRPAIGQHFQAGNDEWLLDLRTGENVRNSRLWACELMEFTEQGFS